MTALSTNEAIFLGTVLEGVFYGVYCVVFTLYLSIQKQSTPSRFISYPLSALFLLCTTFICLDFTQQFITIFRSTGTNAPALISRINITASVIYCLVDFISQCVLIYRCWIMWDRKYHVVFLPFVLALASFSMTLTVTIKLALLGLNPPPVWFFPLGAASFSVSALVNSVVTALLVLKLVVAHREVNQDGQLGSTQSLLPVIAVLAESGIFTVVAQIIWTVLFGLQNTGFNSVDGSITMIYGITPTIIIVRVTMGKAFAPRSTHVVSSMRFGNKSEAVTSITAQGSSSQLSQKIGNELKVAYVPEHADKTVC